MAFKLLAQPGGCERPAGSEIVWTQKHVGGIAARRIADEGTTEKLGARILYDE
ncbi:hypothetical protein IB267_18385 [Ensifer sp. ENS09]|uniref:hypothetical protein n=1 Tax=Ensifer sp. ENS09 TaxID=2769263 RepID=UPI00178451F4|nr:hypothetical protein [Ensifer sp. ENS09]MBD9650314.1 hypothetical protein [Ensifer sp. ENS09]